MIPVPAPLIRRTDLKLGRRRAIGRGPRLHLANYLRDLPPIPTAVDYTGPANEVLRDVMGNDIMGDCVIAAGYHIVGTETGNAGDLFHAQAPQIIGDYSAIGGYVQGDPSTDNGCNEVDALNYWTSHGFANGTKLLAWLSLNPQNKAELQAAQFLFENLLFGIELPDSWISPSFPMADGFTWDVAGVANPNNGHAVIGAGYDDKAITVVTWGLYGKLTYEAIATYCAPGSGGEIYVLLTPDQLQKGQTKAPNGVAWDELIADWNKLGGHAVPPDTPIPPPLPPTPGPAPAPSQVVTLADAQSWAIAGLAANWPKTKR